MGATIRPSATFNNGAGTTSMAVTKPTDAAPKDWCLIFCQTWDNDYNGINAVASPPTGFTQLVAATSTSGTDGNNLQVFGRQLNGTEGASFTVNYAASADPQSVCICVKDTDGLDVTNSRNASSYVSTRSVVATTARTDDALVIVCTGGYYVASWDTKPTGYTTVYEAYGQLVSSYAQPRAGAVPTTWASSASAELAPQVVLVMRPLYVPQPQMIASTMGIR